MLINLGYFILLVVFGCVGIAFFTSYSRTGENAELFVALYFGLLAVLSLMVMVPVSVV